MKYKTVKRILAVTPILIGMFSFVTDIQNDQPWFGLGALALGLVACPLILWLW